MKEQITALLNFNYSHAYSKKRNEQFVSSYDKRQIKDLVEDRLILDDEYNTTKYNIIKLKPYQILQSHLTLNGHTYLEN
jgi:hypothetical protein